MLAAVFQTSGSNVTPAAARAWCSSLRSGGVALVILCLSVYLPGLRAIPPVDRDESRFAQASRTMLETGDFVVPRIQNVTRLNKPPLIYWLQCVSAKVLGDAPSADGSGEWGNGNIWVYRMPSVCCAIGAVLLTWRIGCRLWDARAAWLGAALLAICPMVVWDAHQARADQLLLVTTTGTMLALLNCWMRGRTAAGEQDRPKLSVLWPALFWTFLGLGILAKGPITPLIALLTATAISITTRSVRWLWHLRPLLGALIIAALVGPWVYLVVRSVGWTNYWPVIVRETIGRSVDSKNAENHWAPPGYHTVLLAVLFWPGSLLTLAAIGTGIQRVWRRRTAGPGDAAPELFLLSWLLPAWLVFELIATKLPHYTMPLYPAVALLSARAIFSSAARVRKIGDRVGIALWTGIGFFGLSLAIVFIASAGDLREHVSAVHVTFGWCYLALLAAMIFFASRAANRARMFAAHATAIGVVVSWCWIALGGVLPESRDVWISPRLVEVVSRASPAASPPVALVGFQEDSAIFLFRGRASRLEPGDISPWLSEHPDGVLAVDALQLPEAAAAAGMVRPIAGTIEGFNYSTGRRVRVHVYSPRPRTLSHR